MLRLAFEMQISGKSIDSILRRVHGKYGTIFYTNLSTVNCQLA